MPPERLPDRSPQPTGAAPTRAAAATTPGPDIAALQASAGNQAVARAFGGSPAADPGTVELIETVIRGRDAYLVRFIDDFSACTDTQRLQLIAIVHDQTWVANSDESVLERIWDSFQGRLPDVVDQNRALWRHSLDVGADPSGMGSLTPLRRAFEQDVKTTARHYMRANLAYTDEELTRLGLRTSEAGAGPAAETEAELRRRAIRGLAEQAVNAFTARDALRQIAVGWNYGGAIGRTGDVRYVRAYFDPERPPAEDFVSAGTTTSKTWPEVKREWDKTQAVLDSVSAASPTVYAAIARGDRADVQSLAGDDPAAAAATARRLLEATRANIVATIPKIDSGDLDWRDLRPIHEQFYSGRAAPSGTAWNRELNKAVAQDVIGDHETREFWISLGLGTLAAAAFIVAEFASGGAATVLLVGGAALSGAQAVRSWENWEDLATAARGSVSSETQLVSQGQVDAAALAAVLDTVFAFLDIAAPLVRGARAAQAAAELEATVARRAADAALASLPEGTAAAAAIERSVAELGVERTLAASGKTPEQLLALLPEGSHARARIAAHAAGASSAEAATALARFGLTEAEAAWAAGRALPELLGELPNAVLSGTLRREVGDRMLAEAIETIGPRQVIERCGGWGRVAQALGKEETQAGTMLMRWRDAVFTDLEDYVRQTLRGDVQRTGTAKNVTNDIDMSFVGPRAAEVKHGAAEYLARRLGVPPSDAEFNRLMLAGLFTDPRRMHAYDILPDSIRAQMAATQATVEEGLIWNHRLWQATQAGNEELSASIRTQMRELGVREFGYTPLSSADVSRLYALQDETHAAMTRAIEAGDEQAQARAAQRLGETQALINATEGGGYFSGGGVRRYVSERPGERGFDPLLGGTRRTGPSLSTEAFTAILDQLDKLDHALLEMGHGADHLVPGVRGIGKYGGRLAEVLGESTVLPSSAAWDALVATCARLKSTADNAGAIARMSSQEITQLAAEARSVFEQLRSASAGLLTEARWFAQLPEMSRAAQRVQFLATAHTKLLAALDAATSNLTLVIGLARRASDGGPASP